MREIEECPIKPWCLYRMSMTYGSKVEYFRRNVDRADFALKTIIGSITQIRECQRVNEDACRYDSNMLQAIYTSRRDPTLKTSF